MAKTKQVETPLLQANGRGYCSGVWLTPAQAKALAASMEIHIAQFEGLLPPKPSDNQKNYLAKIKERYEAALLVGAL